MADDEKPVEQQIQEGAMLDLSKAQAFIIVAENGQIFRATNPGAEIPHVVEYDKCAIVGVCAPGVAAGREVHCYASPFVPDQKGRLSAADQYMIIALAKNLPHIKILVSVLQDIVNTEGISFEAAYEKFIGDVKRHQLNKGTPGNVLPWKM